jgi:hypothetical protein
MGLRHVHEQERVASAGRPAYRRQKGTATLGVGAGGERREKENSRVGVIDPRRPWTPEDVEHSRAFSRTMLIGAPSAEVESGYTHMHT